MKAQDCFRQVEFLSVCEYQAYRRGTSLNAFAEQLGVNRSTIWRWKRGRGVMNIHQASMLSFFLNVPMGEYIGNFACKLELELFNEQFPIIADR